MNTFNNKEKITQNSKWIDSEISDFFYFLNSNVKITHFLVNKGHIPAITPFRFKQCRYPAETAKKVIDTNFNAYAIIDAGHIYDDYGKSHAKSYDERLLLAKNKIPLFIAEIEKTINRSNNEMFRRIGVKVLNSENIELIRTYEDGTDEGDDHYGLEVYLKFYYKK